MRPAEDLGRRRPALGRAEQLDEPRACLGVVGAPRGVDLDLRRERDRVDRRARAGRRRAGGSAASASRRVRRRLDVEDRERRVERRRGPRCSPDERLRAHAVEELGDRLVDAAPAGDALPARLDEADQPVAAWSIGHDRVLRLAPACGRRSAPRRRARAARGPGSPRTARPTRSARARTRSRRPGSGTARRRRRSRCCASGTPGRSGSGTPPRRRRTCRSRPATSVRAAGRPELRVARAQRPARLADADDPALVEVQQVAVVLADADRAQLARPLVRLAGGRGGRGPGARPRGHPSQPWRPQRHPRARPAPARRCAAAARARAAGRVVDVTQRPARGRSNVPPQLRAGQRAAEQRRVGRAPRRSRRSGRGRRAASRRRWPRSARRRCAISCPRSRPATPVERRPTPRSARRLRAPRRRRDDALDVEPEQVGRALLQRALDRELHRALRRRAAAARSLQPQPRDAVLDARAARRRRRGTPCTGARCRAPPAPASSSGTG